MASQSAQVDGLAREFHEMISIISIGFWGTLYHNIIRNPKMM